MSCSNIFKTVTIKQMQLVVLTDTFVIITAVAWSREGLIGGGKAVPIAYENVICS